jgi:hypothetical protein
VRSIPDSDGTLASHLLCCIDVQRSQANGGDRVQERVPGAGGL